MEQQVRKGLLSTLSFGVRYLPMIIEVVYSMNVVFLYDMLCYIDHEKCKDKHIEKCFLIASWTH